MQRDKGKFGGFVGENSGNIANSYSVTNVMNKKALAGGFAAENRGEVKECYAYSPLKALTGGFVGMDAGEVENCYFLHNEDKNDDKKLTHLRDIRRGEYKKELEDADDYGKLGFETKSIWELGDDEIPLKFVEENWNSPVPEAEDDYKIITISSVSGLMSFADKVNHRGRNAMAAHVTLTKDLDLGGKEWTPIGLDEDCAFEGIFDGGGHTIKNFTMNQKKMKHKGFFGYLKGEVYNLTVDCTMNGGDCCGGLAAVNQGTIGSCAAIVEIKGKCQIAGGLVGENAGEITLSYAAGHAKGGIIILPWFFAGGGLIVAGLAATVFILLPGGVGSGGLNTFAPVPYDEDQVRSDDTEDLEPSTEGRFVSFQFEQNIDVDLFSGKCAFNFKNPGNSNHDIVVQLQFTDAQAERIMGSTGRSEADQQELEATEGYDPETYRMVLAESGAIRPGYELADLQLVEQANGATLPPGEYNAIVYLIFYDIETHNRAMLESQLPVVITVH